jgi:hypothetical protein
MNLIERAAALLTPHMDEKSRHTFLVLAFYSHHRQVYDTIDQSGAPRDFIVRCIAKLSTLGKLEGRHPLSLLLEVVAKETGEEKQEDFRQLIVEWDASEEPATAPMAELPVSRTLTSVNVEAGGVYAGGKIQGNVNTGIQFNGPVSANTIVNGDKITHHYHGGKSGNDRDE